MKVIGDSISGEVSASRTSRNMVSCGGNLIFVFFHWEPRRAAGGFVLGRPGPVLSRSAQAGAFLGHRRGAGRTGIAKTLRARRWAKNGLDQTAARLPDLWRLNRSIELGKTKRAVEMEESADGDRRHRRTYWDLAECS